MKIDYTECQFSNKRQRSIQIVIITNQEVEQRNQFRYLESINNYRKQKT